MLQRFEVLDALRGLCALCVLFFHTRIIGSFTEAQFFRSSFVFVDFFFILSGFVLTHGYAFRENVVFKKFISSRFMRIYPLHLCMFLVYFIFEIGKYIAHTYYNISFGALPFTESGSFSEIIPNLLLIQAWFTAFKADSFNGVSWSISIEFYLYIIFILTVIYIKTYKKLAWLIISLTAFYCIHSSLYIPTLQSLHGLSCFFLGSLIYCIRRKIKNISDNFFILSFLEIFSLFIIVLALSSHIIKNEIIISLIFAGSIFIFSFEGGILSKLLHKYPFQYIGMLSYSIYMTHSIIIFLLKSFAVAISKHTSLNFVQINKYTLFLDFNNIIVNNIVILFIIATTILVSHFTFKHIELRYKNIKTVS